MRTGLRALGRRSLHLGIVSRGVECVRVLRPCVETTSLFRVLSEEVLNAIRLGKKRGRADAQGGWSAEDTSRSESARNS